jgi:hypothetical protein
MKNVDFGRDGDGQLHRVFDDFPFGISDFPNDSRRCVVKKKPDENRPEAGEKIRLHQATTMPKAKKTAR